MPEKNDNEVGALWLKESKQGTKYMSGKLEIGGETVYVAVFKNNYKKKDTHPDYRILRSEQQGGGQQSKQEQAVKETFQDDIPF